jgi:hypothetical protein
MTISSHPFRISEVRIREALLYIPEHVVLRTDENMLSAKRRDRQTHRQRRAGL